MGMNGIHRIIDLNELYKKTWLRYKIYGSTNYRLLLENGLYIIINEKEDYLTGKAKYILQIYVEPGNKVFQKDNIVIDKKRLKYTDLEICIDNILHKGDGEDDELTSIK